jgi:hypothetical protein
VLANSEDRRQAFALGKRQSGAITSPCACFRAGRSGTVRGGLTDAEDGAVESAGRRSVGQHALRAHRQDLRFLAHKRPEIVSQRYGDARCPARPSLPSVESRLQPLRMNCSGLSESIYRTPSQSFPPPVSCRRPVPFSLAPRTKYPLVTDCFGAVPARSVAKDQISTEPTTRTTSWRAGSRFRAGPGFPVTAGRATAPSAAQRAAL